MWYYTLNGQQAGPIPQAELQQKLQSELPPTTLIWRQGMAEWTKANEVAEFSTASVAVSPDTPSNNPYAAPTSVTYQPQEISTDSEIPEQPILLDIGFCITQAWKVTCKNFGTLFLFGLAYFGAIFFVSFVFSAIGTLIDGPQPAASPVPDSFYENMEPSEAFMHGLQSSSQAGIASRLLEIPSQIIQAFLGMGAFAFSLSLVRGQEASIAQLYSQSGRKLLNVIGATCLYFLMVLVGCFFFIIPGIYLGLRFKFYYAAIIDKDLNVIESLKYSSQLTRDNRLNLFGLWFLTCLVVAAGAIAFLFGLLWAMPTAWLASTISYCYLHAGEKSIAVQN